MRHLLSFPMFAHGIGAFQNASCPRVLPTASLFCSYTCPVANQARHLSDSYLEERLLLRNAVDNTNYLGNWIFNDAQLLAALEFSG